MIATAFRCLWRLECLPISLLSLNNFLQREIASGRFADRTAVIEHALRLMQRDREEAILGIKAGLADAAAGRSAATR